MDQRRPGAEPHPAEAAEHPVNPSHPRVGRTEPCRHDTAQRPPRRPARGPLSVTVALDEYDLRCLQTRYGDGTHADLVEAERVATAMSGLDRITAKVWLAVHRPRDPDGLPLAGLAAATVLAVTGAATWWLTRT